MSPAQLLATSLPHGSSSLAAGVLAATKAKSSSGASGTLIFLVLLLVLGYFLLIRPQRQRARRAQQVNKEIGVGDKVVLSSGIIGHVESFSGDNAFVEIAPGTVIEVLRRAVVQRIDDVGESADDLIGEDGEHEAGPSTGLGHDDSEDDAGDPYSVPPLEPGSHDGPDDHDGDDETDVGGDAK